MITILTQNYNLINISNFNNISFISQLNEEGIEEYFIVVDQNIILGKYNLTDIPNIIAWIGSTIGNYKTTDNLCLTMPRNEDNENAEND